MEHEKGRILEQIGTDNIICLTDATNITMFLKSYI